MNIKSMLFPFTAIALVAVVSYHFGGSMRGRNPNQNIAESNHSPHSQRNNVDLSNKERGSINTPPAVNMPIKSERTINISPQKTVLQYTPTTVPDSILDEQMIQLRNNGQMVADQIWGSGLPESHRRQLTAEHQARVNAEADRIRMAKQQLAAIRQLHSQGTLDDVATERAMWRVIGLPQDTVENISVPTKPEPAPALLGTHGVVNGILFSEGTPTAIIDGKVFGVGQSIYGVKVVKIEQGYVEFEKSGVRWSQMVTESPSSNWP